VSSGQTVLVAHKSKLYALDATTFQSKWTFPNSTGDKISPTALYGTPAVDAGIVFIPAYNGKLYAVDLNTGKSKWASPFNTGEKLVGGVLATGGKVYFGSSNSKVYALNGANGEKLWSYTTGKEVWSTPVLSGTTLLVTSLDGSLYGLDAASGEKLWSFKTAAGLAASPALDPSGNTVYVAGFDSRLRAIDTSTHQERWAASGDNWFWGTPLVAGGAVFAGALDNKIYAFDTSTGDAHWSRPFEADAPVRAAVVMAGNVVLAVDRKGHVYALSPEDGSMSPGKALNLNAKVTADPLVLSNGQVLISTTGGEMIRIDPTRLEIVSRTKLGS